MGVIDDAVAAAQAVRADAEAVIAGANTAAVFVGIVSEADKSLSASIQAVTALAASLDRRRKVVEDRLKEFEVGPAARIQKKLSALGEPAVSKFGTAVSEIITVDLAASKKVATARAEYDAALREAKSAQEALNSALADLSRIELTANALATPTGAYASALEAAERVAPSDTSRAMLALVDATLGHQAVTTSIANSGGLLAAAQAEKVKEAWDSLRSPVEEAAKKWVEAQTNVLTKSESLLKEERDFSSDKVEIAAKRMAKIAGVLNPPPVEPDPVEPDD